MNLADIKRKVADLSVEERSQLAAYLAELDETQYQAEMNRHMQAMDAGKKVTAEEFEARHKELKTRGR